MKIPMMLSCKEAARLFLEAQEHSLSIGEYLALILHRFVCGLCRRYWKQVMFVQNVIRKYTGNIQEADFGSAPLLSIESREKMKNSLKGL